MENMEIYNSFRSVPDSAKKNITGGRLKNFTNINAMWRIQMLTNMFGPCGIGWKYIIREKRLVHGTNDEIAAIVDIDLYYKVDGAWSDAVPGTGGSMFAEKQKNGIYVSDECFKMALTDALSVACKALGMGADVYWDSDPTKYDKLCNNAPPPPPPQDDAPPPPPPQNEDLPIRCADCGEVIRPAKKRDGARWLVPDIVKYCDRVFGRPLCDKCISKAVRRANDGASG